MHAIGTVSHAANAALPLLPRHAERVRWQRDQALTVASMAELEALLQRAVALLEGAGIRWVGGPGLPGQGLVSTLGIAL